MYSRAIRAKTLIVMISAPTVFPTITSRDLRHKGQATRNASTVGAAIATVTQNQLICLRQARNVLEVAAKVDTSKGPANHLRQGFDAPPKRDVMVSRAKAEAGHYVPRGPGSA
jgi:hypothetical protein